MAVFAGDGKDEGNWHMRVYNAHEGGIVFNPEQARVRVGVRVGVRVRVRGRHRLQPGAG